MARGGSDSGLMGPSEQCFESHSLLRSDANPLAAVINSDRTSTRFTTLSRITPLSGFKIRSRPESIGQ